MHGSVGAWAKSYYFATMQRDLGRMLQIERATLSGIVTTLVRKGLIAQMPGSEDQRQRVLRLTGAGMKLWEELPDPLALIRAIAFDGADEAELATAIRVLQTATQRLNDHMSEVEHVAHRRDRLTPPAGWPPSRRS